MVAGGSDREIKCEWGGYNIMGLLLLVPHRGRTTALDEGWILVNEGGRQQI